MLPGRRAFVVALALAACGGDDAPTQMDAPLPDGVMIDSPDDCDPATIYFAGEVLAWDATSANPSGVAGITITQRDDVTKTGTTMMNGSFELCIANDPTVTVDITPPIGSDHVGGFAIVDKDVIAGGGSFSVRMFERARAVTDYNFDDAKAHVFVHVNNAGRQAAVVSMFEYSYVWNGTEWLGGETTGKDIYFANVDPANGETKLDVDRAVGVPEKIPLAAGKLTFVVVNAVN